MPRRSRKEHKSPLLSSDRKARGQELVVAAMVDDMEQARDFQALLKSNEIPAMIRHQRDDLTEQMRFAVMVPEEFADEAHVIVESQDAYDDFYDIGPEAEEETDLNDEKFDDNF